MDGLKFGEDVSDEARQRAAIIRALRAGEPMARIALAHGVTMTAVARINYDFPGPRDLYPWPVSA